jgi:hypothetical protein
MFFARRLPHGFAEFMTRLLRTRQVNLSEVADSPSTVAIWIHIYERYTFLCPSGNCGQLHYKPYWAEHNERNEGPSERAYVLEDLSETRTEALKEHFSKERYKSSRQVWVQLANARCSTCGTKFSFERGSMMPTVYYGIDQRRLGRMGKRPITQSGRPKTCSGWDKRTPPEDKHMSRFWQRSVPRISTRSRPPCAPGTPILP